MASIRKRKNSYQITVSNGRDATGKQILETTTFIPGPSKTDKQNQKALEKFAMEFEYKVKSGKYLDGEKLSFQEFMEIWFQDYAAHHLEDTTLQQYRHLLDTHIIPEIGHLKLSKILPVHLNKLYNTLSTTRKDNRSGGYSPKTIKHIHTTISGIFAAALRWNIVSDNPCDRVEPPKMVPTRDKLKFFTIEQSNTFLGLLDKEYTTTYKAHDRVDDTGKSYHVSDYSETRRIPTQFKLFFHLALFCGLRRGEIIALEWSDLDFNENSVNITKSTTCVKGKPITKSTKTNSSIRKISVPVSVMNLAKQYRKEQMEYRMALGSQWIGNNYIFIQWNGSQMHPDSPYKTFKKIIKRYNETIEKEEDKLPDIPLHGLRHTSATLLISQNVDVKTVSNRLGHAQTSTTMDIYSHALRKMDEQAANVLDDLLVKKA